MNLNISAQMQALSEALILARRAKISDDVFFGALGKNISYSGLTKLKEPQLRTADYAPLFSIKHMHKDMRLAQDMPTSGDLPLLATISERLAVAESAGYDNEDFAALFKLLPSSV